MSEPVIYRRTATISLSLRETPQDIVGQCAYVDTTTGFLDIKDVFSGVCITATHAFVMQGWTWANDTVEFTLAQGGVVAYAASSPLSTVRPGHLSGALFNAQQQQVGNFEFQVIGNTLISGD